MGFKSLFKKAMSKPETSINEASGSDINTAFGNDTNKNAITDAFQGSYGGLRIKAALLPDKPVPFWGDEYRSYPFVGINGYSDTIAIQAQAGKETGYLRDRLRMFEGDDTDNILNAQVAKGTGIPKDAFIFYHQQDISTVGSGSVKNSETIFHTKKDSVCYRQGLKSFAIQQALSIDEDGRLYPNPKKSGGIVLMPKNRGTGRGLENLRSEASSGVMRVIKLTLEHIVGIVQRTGGLKGLARIFTGSDDMKFPHANSGVISAYITGMRNYNRMLKTRRGENDKVIFPKPYENTIPEGNPKFGQFNEFIKLNLKLTPADVQDPAKLIDNVGLKMRAWILSNDIRTVCEKLIIPYFLKTPFENTYCMSEVSPEDLASPEMTEAFAVYQKCMESGVITESVEEITEAANEINSDVTRNYLMDLCRGCTRQRKQTFMFTPEERTVTTTKVDGDVVTKSVGVKRIFARILFGSLNSHPIDAAFINKHGENFISRYHTLDYSSLFKGFAGILNPEAPQTFKCCRICGYMVTFDYDESIEDALIAELGGKTDDELFPLRLLEAYHKNSKFLREPAVFNLNYFIDYDFISSGYEYVTTQDIVDMSSKRIPDKLKIGATLHGSRLYSEFVRADKAVRMNNNNNQLAANGRRS